MEFRGRITDVSRGFLSDTYRIVVEINAGMVNREDLSKYAQLDALRIKMSKWSEKRSLDANAYFHVLVGKIAEQLRISKIRCKNELIARYGQVEYVDDVPVVIKTNIQPEQMWEQEFLHCFPCKVSIENDKEVIFYRVYRPTHTYSSIEFFHLLDGTIEDAKALGIETMTPAETERIKALWQTRDTQSLRIS